MALEGANSEEIFQEMMLEDPIKGGKLHVNKILQIKVTNI